MSLRSQAVWDVFLLAGSILLLCQSSEGWAEEGALRPHAPEPMVFDLVRPLGVRAGEFEVNTLGIIPFRRSSSSTGGLFPSEEGTEQDPPANKGLGPTIEWAPEIEFAPIDNLALEFELPFADSTLAEYKAGVQWSFTPTSDGLFIDGIQGLINIDADGSSITPALLYLSAWRFRGIYTFQTMLGARSTVGSRAAANETDLLINPTLYAELGSGRAVGGESNITVSEKGAIECRIMPQFSLHVGIITIQLGAGVVFDDERAVGETAFRLVAD